MNAEYFLKYVEYAKAYVIASQTDPEGIISTGETTEMFIDNIKNGIFTAKIFEIEEPVKKLLALTNPPNKNDQINLPFPNMFLDVGFTKEELAGS